MSKIKYDLIFSLGGSCAWASQLRARELRLASLPFDWLFVVDDTPLLRLATCFNENFEHWMERDNLLPLIGDERSKTASGLQYKDSYTGYRFIHDFHRPVNEDASYFNVKSQYERRIKRLYDYIHKSTKILMCYDAGWTVDYSIVEHLRNVILNKFGSNKDINVVINEFSCIEEKTITPFPWMTVNRFAHSKNNYIFTYCSYEYSVLDNLELSGACPLPTGHNRWLNWGHPLGGIKLQFLPRMRSIVRSRLSFGKNVLLDIGIGKFGK